MEYRLSKLSDGNFILEAQELAMRSAPIMGIEQDDYKPIASLHKIEGVPTLTFDEVVAKEIGYVDINKWILNKWSLLIKNDPLYLLNNPERYKDLYDGYMAGLKYNIGKNYSIMDIMSALSFGATKVKENGFMSNKDETDFINSLTTTQWQVEIEMENYSKPKDGHSAVHKDTRPKITNNTITITKIIA